MKARRITAAPIEGHKIAAIENGQVVGEYSMDNNGNKVTNVSSGENVATVTYETPNGAVYCDTIDLEHGARMSSNQLTGPSRKLIIHKAAEPAPQEVAIHHYQSGPSSGLGGVLIALTVAYVIGYAIYSSWILPAIKYWANYFGN